jgi:hypothetical protein
MITVCTIIGPAYVTSKVALPTTRMDNTSGTHVEINCPEAASLLPPYIPRGLKLGK